MLEIHNCTRILVILYDQVNWELLSNSLLSLSLSLSLSVSLSLSLVEHQLSRMMGKLQPWLSEFIFG